MVVKCVEVITFVGAIVRDLVVLGSERCIVNDGPDKQENEEMGI
jgi:hypothetical protein